MKKYHYIKTPNPEYFKFVIGFVLDQNILANHRMWIDRSNHGHLWNTYKENTVLCFSKKGEGKWLLEYSPEKFFRTDKKYSMNGEWVSFDQLFSLLSFRPTSITVPLNDGYTATVTKDSIQVGCQTFPAEKARELVQALEELS